MAFDAAVAATPYFDVARTLLQKFKFSGALELEALLGSWLWQRVRETHWIHSVDVIAAVPVHWRARLTAQCCPAVLLSRSLGRQARLPVRSLLRRRRRVAHQRDVPFEQRPANVRGVFDVPRPGNVDGQRICIVDDVMTSGATLHEVAKVLKAAGAAFVGGAVLARGGQAGVWEGSATEVAGFSPIRSLDQGENT